MKSIGLKPFQLLFITLCTLFPFVQHAAELFPFLELLPEHQTLWWEIGQ